MSRSLGQGKKTAQKAWHGRGPTSLPGPLCCEGLGLDFFLLLSWHLRQVEWDGLLALLLSKMSAAAPSLSTSVPRLSSGWVSRSVALAVNKAKTMRPWIAKG